jgi:type IV secretion system protein VirB5
MNNRLKVAVAACLVAGAFGAGNARAQGIPVIDVANLAQTIAQVMNDIKQINNQVQQITQLQTQLNSINGMRNLGNILNNPMLRNYVPAEAYTYLNAVNTSGYSGLNATAKSLRDAGMVYNCLDLTGAARTACQAALAQPYQQKGLLQDAMKSAAGRLVQINALMDRIHQRPEGGAGNPGPHRRRKRSSRARSFSSANAARYGRQRRAHRALA